MHRRALARADARVEHPHLRILEQYEVVVGRRHDGVQPGRPVN
jgi:hypothetical protein